MPAVLPPAERARHAWRGVRSAGVFYLALLVVVLASAYSEGEALVSFIVGDALTTLLVIGFAWPIRREILRLFRPPRMDAVSWGLLLLAPAGLWLLNHGLQLALSGLPGTMVSDPVVDLRESGASTGAVFLLVCVTPPLLEEVAFRGVLLERIRETFGAQSAAIVVSILFSILHLAMLSFFPFAALALVFAALRLRTGSLWPPIAAHALFNAPGVFPSP